MTLRAFLPGLSCRICFGHSFIHIFCHLSLPYNVASLFRLLLWLTAIISSCEVYYSMGQRWLYPAVQWYMGFFLAFRTLLLSLMHMGFPECCLSPMCFVLSGLRWSSVAVCDITRTSMSSCLFSFFSLLRKFSHCEHRPFLVYCVCGPTCGFLSSSFWEQKSSIPWTWKVPVIFMFRKTFLLGYWSIL